MHEPSEGIMVESRAFWALYACGVALSIGAMVGVLWLVAQLVQWAVRP